MIPVATLSFLDPGKVSSEGHQRDCSVALERFCDFRNIRPLRLGSQVDVHGVTVPISGDRGGDRAIGVG